MSFQISIILPVYNEAENIRQAIDGIERYVSESFEIIIVYDFPQDNTVNVVNEFFSNKENIRLVYNKKGGLINAIKKGFNTSKGEAIIVMSPDLADNPTTIRHMYRKIKEGFDLVCASRYSQGGKRINQNSLKMQLSRIAGKLSPILLGIPTSDITNGYKMYQKNVLKKIPIRSTGGWEFALELTIKAHFQGFKVAEVGTVSKNRKFGKSKFKLFKWLPYYIYWYIYGIVQRLKS